MSARTDKTESLQVLRYFYFKHGYYCPTEWVEWTWTSNEMHLTYSQFRKNKTSQVFFLTIIPVTSYFHVKNLKCSLLSPDWKPLSVACGNRIYPNDNEGLNLHSSDVEHTSLKSVSRSLEAVETQLQSTLLVWFVCLEKPDDEKFCPWFWKKENTSLVKSFPFLIRYVLFPFKLCNSIRRDHGGFGFQLMWGRS